MYVSLLIDWVALPDTDNDGWVNVHVIPHKQSQIPASPTTPVSLRKGQARTNWRPLPMNYLQPPCELMRTAFAGTK